MRSVVFTLLLCGVALGACGATIAGAPPSREQVAVLVNRAAYARLQPEIKQYEGDVEERFPVRLQVVQGKWANPDEVRRTIRRLHLTRKISGVVLVGAIPMHKFHMHDFDNPNPLYYEDYDLQFVDKNGDGISDAYTGTPNLKLWVANLRGVEDEKDEGIDVLKAFLRKTHAYYTGKQSIEPRALAVTTSDWPDGADIFARDVGRPLFGDNGVDVLSCQAATLTALRQAFAKHTYTMFYIQVHSTPTRQDMEGGTLYSKEIAQIPTGALFTINHGCSICNWAKNVSREKGRNTGMSWVFGKGVGQAVVGNVRTGMVYGQQQIYERILAGDYLGKAYLAGKKAGEAEMHRDYPNGEVVAGVLFIGNPFLYIDRKHELSKPTAREQSQMIHKGSIVLENEVLSVELYKDRPFPLSYKHKPSGTQFGGTPAEGLLAVNGKAAPWRDWKVVVEKSGTPGRVSYVLRSTGEDFALRFAYELRDYVLAMQVTVVSDPRNTVGSIEWLHAPLLTCDTPGTTVWREEWTQKGWDEKSGRGLWTPQVVEKPIVEIKPDSEPRPAVYCCFYSPDKVCASVLTNQRYMPLRNQVTRNGDRSTYALSLAPYQFRARKRCLEPLKAQVAFLPDINNDGRIDASDFQLWVNRQLPQPWPTHRNAIWYKIYCCEPGGPVTTTFAQAEEIIERVHRYTDGLPQIAYLVGWQYDGHDTGYPSIDKVNGKLGTREELWQLHRRAKEQLNTTLSYHINLDDSYPNHPGWDESVIGRDRDGSLMRWEEFHGEQSYHITHTKDVESGKVFDRLNAMMREVPVEGSIHIDAFRDMNWSWEPDGFIGPIEELECGVKPIVEFFRSRGIDVTIESMDSQGAEWCGIVSGILHVGRPIDLPQLRHGKMLYGGRGWPPSLWNWGLGSSINWDVVYTEDGKDFYASGAWEQLLDGIYLGTLLYHFYLEREMTAAHIDDESARLVFSDGAETFVKRDSSRLLVTLGDVVIADNYDRFIPRGNSIYAYSRDGSHKSWVLPPQFRDKDVEVRKLGDPGGAATAVHTGDRIDLDLKPRTPIKISLKA